jgi:hypothetical protein
MQSLDFVEEAQKLREAARRARRLASNMIQNVERLRLCTYADDLDARADRLDYNQSTTPKAAGQPPGRGIA